MTREYPESSIQKEIVMQLRGMNILVMLGGSLDSVKKYAYGSNTFSVVNQAKSMGYTNGQPDLVVVYGGKVYFIEVKSMTGKQSDTQILFEQKCLEQNQKYFVARSVDDVKRVLGIDWVLTP